MNRAAVIVLVIAAIIAAVVGGTALWDTVVPGDLKLDKAAALRTFDATSVEDAESFEALVRVLFLFSQAALIVVLALYVKRGPALVKESAAGPIGTGFLLGIMGLCLVWAAQLPFTLIETWWARRNDVDEVGYLEAVLGGFLGLGGTAISVCVILGVAMGFAKLVRSAWWAPAAIVLVAIGAVFAFVAPYLTPDLDRPDAAIAADAERLAEQEGLSDVPVRVQNVRELTEAPNAYAFGLGVSRKVVLWDTLADDFPRTEVRTVVAHELGHHEHDHIAKSLGWTAIGLLPAGLIVMLLTRRRGGLTQPETVPLALLVFVVVGLVLTPLQSTASRRYEAEADWAALEAARDPDAQAALFRRFSDELRADPDPPGWWHVAFDSHPSGAERVAMARAWRERQGRQLAGAP